MDKPEISRETPHRIVNRPVRKKDAMALVTGKPVYMEDVAPADCLVVKVLRSPHANAIVEEIRPFIPGRTCRISALPWPDRPTLSQAPMTA